jgi:hypothetical protein
MPTAKTTIIEQIFNQRFSVASGTMPNPLVTLQDVSTAISDYNATNPAAAMSTRNPANFFKDFIRNRASANRNWPVVALTAGFTARQVTLANACFEFVPLPAGQVDAFPSATFAQPTAITPKHQIESVSLPLASRRLGRKDEPWLIQVITRLRIVEAHFSLVSGKAIKQVDLLQMSVKLAGTEIDALFLAHEEVAPGRFEEVIITCEAKGGRDDILEDQILRQAKAPFSMRQVTQGRVIPIAVKCVAPSTIHVIEFEELDRETYAKVNSIAIACDSLFEIKPPVPGICS